MNKKINVERVAEPVREVISSYAQEILNLLGDNVKSIVVFGSAAGKDFVKGKSNVNMLVVCEDIGLPQLKKCHRLVAKGRRKGIIAPLFFTEFYMQTSSDVFPIEFLDMAAMHTVIYGDDPFESLEIGTENLRLECEEQLKGKLVRLRQAYLEGGGSRKHIRSILIESITSFIPVFKGMLRLKGKTPPIGKREAIDAMGIEFGMDKELFHKILDLKLTKVKLSGEELETLYGRYLEEIEKLAMIADKMR